MLGDLIARVVRAGEVKVLDLRIHRKGYRTLPNGQCDLGQDISPNRAWRPAHLAGKTAQIGYRIGLFHLAAIRPSWSAIPSTGCSKSSLGDFMAIHCRETRAVSWRKSKTKVRVHSPLAAGKQTFAGQIAKVPGSSGMGGKSPLGSTISRWACAAATTVGMSPSKAPPVPAQWRGPWSKPFFKLLKRQQIGRNKYNSREEAQRKVFALWRLRAITHLPAHYAEFGCNPMRKNSGTACCHLSPSNSSKNRTCRAPLKPGAIQN